MKLPHLCLPLLLSSLPLLGCGGSEASADSDSSGAEATDAGETHDDSDGHHDGDDGHQDARDGHHDEGAGGVKNDCQIDQAAASGRRAARLTHRCAPAVM